MKTEFGEVGFRKKDSLRGKLASKFGWVLMILSVLGGLYLGVWLCFIGGIVQVIEAVEVDPVNAIGIAFGILRVMVAIPAGWIFFLVVGWIGIYLKFFRES